MRLASRSVLEPGQGTGAIHVTVIYTSYKSSYFLPGGWSVGATRCVYLPQQKLDQAGIVRACRHVQRAVAVLV